MKTIISTLFLSMAACASAGELPSGVDAAVDLAARHSSLDPGYISTKLQPYFFENVVSHCVGNANEGAQPFIFIIAIERTGRVVRTYAMPETNFSKCLAETALQSLVPTPPFGPFLAEFDLRHRR
jgi:hypothetical protein